MMNNRIRVAMKERVTLKVSMEAMAELSTLLAWFGLFSLVSYFL